MTQLGKLSPRLDSQHAVIMGTYITFVYVQLNRDGYNPTKAKYDFYVISKAIPSLKAQLCRNPKKFQAAYSIPNI